MYRPWLISFRKMKDKLEQLVGGTDLSVSGDAVYWNDDRIGTIDNTYDGSNGRLRINFSKVAPLTNAGFETGDKLGSGPYMYRLKVEHGGSVSWSDIGKLVVDR